MGTSLVLGFFDGVHLGHKAVIDSAVQNSYQNKVVMLTFKDSPAKFFDKNEKYILSRERSIDKIKSLGVDEIVLQEFSEIRSMSAEEYLKDIIKKYSPNIIYTGFNYTFGKNKLGDTLLLKMYELKSNFDYVCVLPYKMHGEIVSSTIIKNYLHAGKIKKANLFLGSNFEIEGTVMHGAQIGRTIGFPTANIEYPANIIEIPYGVYAVKIGRFIGIMNYGVKPTLNGKNPVAEIHILNFNQDIYGKRIRVEILDKIRNERKFENLEELKQQIQKDKDKCLKLSL